ncbi:MAG: hypothetical protein PHS54_02915 [Clostridia bacterium]|nr:hypothetical protein [Clostridia bacterium]
MDEKEEKELMQKAKEQLAADNKPMQEESPLEKADRLNKETKEMLERMEKTKSEYEFARANDQMSGRGVLAIPPKSQDQKDKDEADAMAKQLLGH